MLESILTQWSWKQLDAWRWTCSSLRRTHLGWTQLKVSLATSRTEPKKKPSIQSKSLVLQLLLEPTWSRHWNNFYVSSHRRISKESGEVPFMLGCKLWQLATWLGVFEFLWTSFLSAKEVLLEREEFQSTLVSWQRLYSLLLLSFLKLLLELFFYSFHSIVLHSIDVLVFHCLVPLGDFHMSCKPLFKIAFR